MRNKKENDNVLDTREIEVKKVNIKYQCTLFQGAWSRADVFVLKI